MMLSFLLILAGGLALGALLDSGSDSAGDDGPATDEEGRILVEDGTEFGGTSDADNLTTSPEVLDGRGGAPITADIFTGFGDDQVNLLGPDPEVGPLLTDASVRLGADNDLLQIAATDSTISGGTGADRIELYDWGGNAIDLEQADDVLVVQSSNGSGSQIDGGTGDDTVDARALVSGTVLGGPGDDIILTGQQSEPLAGFFVAADGGAGADVMIYEGTPVTTPDVFMRPGLSGGTGADTFGIAFSEASSVDAPNGTENVRLDLVEILDFQPGVDRIVLDARLEDPSYTVGVATLEVDAGADETRIIVPVTSATAVNQELVIYVNGTNVTLADISFGPVNTAIV